VPLSWKEIRHRAITFAKEWTDARWGHAEKQTFWSEFFNVFGVPRQAVDRVEEPVKNLKGVFDFIDLFWPGVVIVEHQSLGGELGKSGSQAYRYVQELTREGRTKEIPRYVIVSDFSRIALHDLEPEDQRFLSPFEGRRVDSIEFALIDFYNYIHAFAFIPRYKQHKREEQDLIHIRAVEIMARLYDSLEAGGYAGDKLERLLLRILFCLFAQDTGIFIQHAFCHYVVNRTASDGTDLGVHLARLFDVLNTPPENRQKHLDRTLALFPYINGELFAESFVFADFNRDMRNALLVCAHFDWSQISPAILGSLFHAVREPRERRQFGSHYTNERDILKVVRSLFLDELWAEFERAKASRSDLKRFHERIAGLRFLDPACGCGNFLVVTYRELRSLEIEILKFLYPGDQPTLDMRTLSLVDVDAFYGIEILEWPAHMAEVAMRLMNHQMNRRLSEAFGQYFVRIPLTKLPTIVCGNALRLDWRGVLPAEKCSYVFGNPPFGGKQFRNAVQKKDMEIVWGAVKGAGVLDYVTGWYLRAAEYVQGTRIVVGFVSTNSITQGEQVGILWKVLFQMGIKIHFAYRPFSWERQAQRKAHVHVVIVGFGSFDVPTKRIYEYDETSDRLTVESAGNISPYLVEGGDNFVLPRSLPLDRAPKMLFGNMPNDGGCLILSDQEKDSLLKEEPEAKRFVRSFLGAEEFLHRKLRWCLWLVDASPADIRAMPEVARRVEGVRAHREGSRRKATRKLAMVPTLFGEIRQPSTRYLLIPSVSSENRSYIPVDFMTETVVGSNLVLFVPGATLFHFGVLISGMHMAWVKLVCGRLESRYRYSVHLVYNNFPWPPEPSAKQRQAVKAAVQGIVDTRKAFPDLSLANLYDPLLMPPALVKRHAELDRAVEQCYRPQLFQTDRQRVEHLFAVYERLTALPRPRTIRAQDDIQS
jgi:hypothetical protein